MKEAGDVISVGGGFAEVKFNRTSACGKCHACGMLSGQNTITVKAENRIGAEVGDHVEVQFTTKNALGTSAWAYLFPLGMLLLGLLLGFNIPVSEIDTEVFAALMAVIFTVVAFVILHCFNSVFKKKFANIYTVTKIVGNN